jgi:hypothetical protein
MLGFGTDSLNFGIGARGGKTLDNHLYLGGSLVYHFGESSGGSTAAGSYSSSVSVFYLGPEAGYDFDLKTVVVRPYMGLGPAIVTGSASGPGASASSSDTKFVVWPGGTVIYGIPDSTFFIAGDLRFVTVPGGPSVGFFAFGGMRLGS